MSTNFMLNQSLIEAKIIPVYNIKSPIYRKYIAIFLFTKTIFLFPAKRELRLVRNRKYSIRRLMRWALKGCKVEIQKADHNSTSGYPTVYLTKDDLDRMMVGILDKEKDKLRNEIYNETLNTRKCS